MMKLKIHGDIPEGIDLKVRLNNDVKELNSAIDNETFYVNEKGKYEIYIEQKSLEKRFNLLNILLFVITCFFRGVINILLMNTESKWYEDVSAYCLRAKIAVNIQEDVDIHFRYYNSKYDNDSNTWEFPSLNIKESFDCDISYTKNPIDIKNKFIDYVKKFLSIVSVNLLVFSYLLYISFDNEIKAGIVITIIILCAILLIWGLVACHEYKRYKKLYRNFD